MTSYPHLHVMMEEETPHSPAYRVGIWIERISYFLIITGAVLQYYEQDQGAGVFLKMGLLYMIIGALFKVLDDLESPTNSEA